MNLITIVHVVHRKKFNFSRCRTPSGSKVVVILGFYCSRKTTFPIIIAIVVNYVPLSYILCAGFSKTGGGGGGGGVTVMDGSMATRVWEQGQIQEFYNGVGVWLDASRKGKSNPMIITVPADGPGGSGVPRCVGVVWNWSQPRLAPVLALMVVVW